MKKNAWLVAIGNFMFPGLGYVYANIKRPLFSWALLILSVWVAVHDWTEIRSILSGQQSITEHFLLFIILYPLVFAWDAYKDVTEQKAGR